MKRYKRIKSLNHTFISSWLAAFFLTVNLAVARPFVHPGGLHTLADLDRMRTNVMAGNHPWIDDWQQLLRDPQAQAKWKPAATANLGDSRQHADLDAHAAYLNALRWCISGDTNNAECAVRICNAWSRKVDQAPRGADIPGLSGIPIFDFALAGELLRIYPGWEAKDFNRYTNMMVRYFYPQCHGFLSYHDGRCISYFWANWDACNIGALIAMGVLCDDTNMFNEGVEYFQHGRGNGCISNAVPFLYSSNFGQWQESGRDQAHAQLGVGLLGSACQVAWNQGVDLFGYANNRLLAGAEYVAKCNLSYPAAEIPYTFYNNCSEARQFALTINGRGRIGWPVWELIYNHYAVRRGLSAPYTKKMTELVRPELGSRDHFGYGTLAFTLTASASPASPHPIPPAPTGLKAAAGVSRVFLNWDKSPDDTAQGYVISRSTNENGGFKVIARWNNLTLPQYTDRSVSNDVTYYYAVAATNQAGLGGNSPIVAAQPLAAGALPAEWTTSMIGEGVDGAATCSAAGDNTFITLVKGGNIGGTDDSLGYIHRSATNDFIFTARLVDGNWTGRDKVGLMVRDSLAPEAKAVALTLGETGGRQCRFGARAEISAQMNWQLGCDYTWLPAWFKIERTGDVFTGYQSVDGMDWFKVGASKVEFSPSCSVGLAVTSGAKSITNVFDNVTIRPNRPFSERAKKEP
ncbi:MAG TPA: alginate lyase family protein [Verrucomicrobiae bacterium]